MSAPEGGLADGASRHAGGEPVTRFGPFRLDRARRRLERDGERVRVGDRALDVLIALAARPGELVSHNDLLDQVWPGMVADGGALRFHITALRKALGDPALIRTVQGRGYCLALPAHALKSERDDAWFLDLGGLQDGAQADGRDRIGRQPVMGVKPKAALSNPRTTPGSKPGTAPTGRGSARGPMPNHTSITQDGLLSTEKKAWLAEQITRIHCEVMGVAPAVVRIVFLTCPDDAGFIAEQSTACANLTCLLRPGPSGQSKAMLLRRPTVIYEEATGAPTEQLMLALQIPPSVEMGQG